MLDSDGGLGYMLLCLGWLFEQGDIWAKTWV